MTDKDDKKKPAEKPISLKPLKFEEAVGELLRVRTHRQKDVGKEGNKKSS